MLGATKRRFLRKKYGQAPFIAPLQLFTLAMFPSWGSSKGAGRKRLTHGAKVIFFWTYLK